MKKFVLFLVCAVAAFTVSAAPQKVDFDKMPKNSQEFVRKNFPQETIKSVEMDREASWDKYTVYFTNGSQVSFEGGSGDCSQIIMKSGRIPATALPAKIKAYAAAKYPDLNIVMFQTTDDGYKVGLSDKSFIDFDKQGDFVKATK